MSKLSRFKAKTVGFIFEEEKGGVDLLFVVVVVALPFPDHPTCGTLKCGFSRRDPRHRSAVGYSSTNVVYFPRPFLKKNSVPELVKPNLS
jgi:hypothetical protein